MGCFCFSSRDAPTPADTAPPTQPVAALPSATDLGVDEEKLELWREHGGGDLEPVLASGAVAVLDAQWVISHAEAGGVLTHRQALPEEAFLSLADLVEATNEYADWLPVAALSYPWLTKDHPDPRGANLARVARALKVLLSEPVYIPRLGVFWDFGSLHQHPDPANGVERTEEQNALFKQGLGCLGTLYSHPKTYVLRLTSFPDGHKAEDQPEGTNVAKYFDRGWCFTEQCWAGLTKAGYLSLDLGLMRGGVEYDCGSLREDCTQDGGRRPPLLPSAFAIELEKKSFTNGKEDYPLVKGLYKDAFEERFGKATKLIYGMLGWGDAEAAQLAEVLASGAAPRLETLIITNNEIRDEGCKALAAALKEGAAPSLKARDAPPRHTPLPRPMLIAPPLACSCSSWTTRSSLSWWPCARSAASSCAEPLQPRPGGKGAGSCGTAARARQRATDPAAAEHDAQRRWGWGAGGRGVCVSRRASAAWDKSVVERASGGSGVRVWLGERHTGDSRGNR